MNLNATDHRLQDGRLRWGRILHPWTMLSRGKNKRGITRTKACIKEKRTKKIEETKYRRYSSKMRQSVQACSAKRKKKAPLKKKERRGCEV